MSAQKIVNKFRKFGLPVDGVAILRNEILAIGDRTIDVHSCNYGYIRTSGRKRYSKGQQITGCDFLNNVTEDLFLVLIIDEGKKLDAYINAARQILDADSDVTILEIDVNKEAIQRAESIPPSLNKIAKISFQYTYQEVGKCDEGVCEYVEDVQCDVEPCESKSFCERVQECIGSVDSDCTLQVGSGCCDYSVEGIRLQAGLIVCFQDEYVWDLETGSPTDISFEGSFGGDPFIIPIQSIGTLSEDETTYTVTAQNIIDWANGYDFGEGLQVIAEGNCLTFLLEVEGSLNFSPINWQDNTSNVSTEDLYTVTDYAGGSIITQIYPTPEFPNQLTYETSSPIQPYAFQVLINDVWTDVTDEVSNGTWQRTNVCDDVITEWRIIDSEENVINSGDVTATCDEATEVTDSVCNWLQAHQTSIEELEQNKANSADLGLTAFSNDYNDLDNLPIIPDVSGFVPYTGATQDVDLGDNQLTTDAIQFDLTPVSAPAIGQMQWNDTDGTVDLVMKGGGVTQQIGMEQYIRAKSSTNGGIAEGYVYYITGATGGNKEVALAQANTPLTSKSTIGVATETVAGGAKAFITTFGIVRALPDALFTGINEGDTLYLSATTPGRFQNTAPAAPNHRIRIGYCIRKQSNNNEIFVSVQLGLDLDELCNVEAPSPANGDIIRYNSGTQVWENQTFPTIPTNNNQLTNGANYITLAQARAGSYTRFFADFAATSVNTNTSNVVIGSVLIPANTVTGNAILEIETAISRAVSGSNPGHRLFINTSNSFTGATQIGSIGISTTALWSKGERSFKCGTGTLRGFAFAIAAAIDDAANTNAPSATSIDWTLDHYILTVANNATGETTTHEYTTVKVLTV